jgi:hypothetical protein
MHPLVRKVLAVVAGFVVASAVMMVIEGLNGHVLFPELGRAAAGVTDREQVRGLMAAAPAAALLVVWLGWAVGAFAGGWTAARLAKPSTPRTLLVLGALLTLAGIANNLMIPPPAWFWLGVLMFFPFTWWGGTQASRPPVHAA